MSFSLFTSRRKQLSSEPFPTRWLHYLASNVRLYHTLDSNEQYALKTITRILVEEKNWEGCKGLVLTDEIKVTISGQAAFLLLGLGHDYFSNVESILIYPFDYVAIQTTVEPGQIVTVIPSFRAGEAWSSGPIVLSWPNALAGGLDESDGRNVVFHEFAHKLDFRNGSADGVPKLKNKVEYDRWTDVMSREYEELIGTSESGHLSLFNSYGATNPAEFFAVTTEAFFERARMLKSHHPALYDVFRAYFNQDPASRSPSTVRTASNSKLE